MDKMTSGLHHFHVRKRIHLKHEKYPHHNKFIRFMDRFIYFVAISGPLVSIPQAFHIWYYKTSANVSYWTWLGFLFGAIFWLIYGIIHKERPIILANVLWIIIDIVILLGAIIYG